MIRVRINTKRVSQDSQPPRLNTECSLIQTEQYSRVAFGSSVDKKRSSQVSGIVRRRFELHIFRLQVSRATSVLPFSRLAFALCSIGLNVKSSTAFLRSSFMCFRTATFALFKINRLAFISETEDVYCAVRTGSLTFWTRNYFFSFSTPVYKMGIIQEPNTIEL